MSTQRIEHGAGLAGADWGEGRLPGPKVLQHRYSHREPTGLVVAACGARQGDRGNLWVRIEHAIIPVEKCPVCYPPTMSSDGQNHLRGDGDPRRADAPRGLRYLRTLVARARLSHRHDLRRVDPAPGRLGADGLPRADDPFDHAGAARGRAEYP